MIHRIIQQKQQHWVLVIHSCDSYQNNNLQ